MKKKLLTAIMAIVMSVCAFGFTACGGGNNGNNGSTTDNNGGTSDHKHDLTFVEGVEATCTEDGSIAYYTCSGCDKWFSDANGKTEITNKANVVIAKGHKLTFVEGRAATCQAGNIAYYICEVCGKWFSDANGKTEIEDWASVVLPKATGHNFVGELCSVCGYHVPTEGLEYKETSGTYMLNGIGTTTDTEIYIADEYEGKAVLSININAFKDCVDITSVTIPEGIVTIATGVFNGCSSLKSVKIPASVTYIAGYELFNGCESLTSLTVAEENTEYYSIDNCIIGKTSKALLVGCQSSIIPSDGSVTSINSYAFYGCSKLKSLTIPDSVTSIGLQAFYGCSELAGMTIPDSVKDIGIWAFSGCSKLIQTEDYVSYVDKWAIAVNSEMSTIAIKEGTKGISGYAFMSCTFLTDLTIAESVENICNKAFSGCSRLKNLIIPVGVTHIDEEAFYICQALENITVAEGNTTYHSAGNCIIETESKTVVLGCKTSVIPDDGSVTVIGKNSFAYCSLDEFIIPVSITYIENSAFYYCMFTDVSYSGTVEQWEAIEKEYGWDSSARSIFGSGKYIISCTDGDITKGF